jgi:hypothetical protein
MKSSMFQIKTSDDVVFVGNNLADVSNNLAENT